MKQKKKKIIIIGAGPAGLAVAYELLKKNALENYDIEIYESQSQIGGISKTLVHKNFRFDLGGHRFFSNIPEINDFFTNFLKEDMLTRNRLSRIYYEKKFYNYPLSVTNALKNLGIFRSFKIVLSWTIRQMNKKLPEKTFEQWVSNRFGDELFKTFFKSYSEKVWGISTSKLSAKWAAQRIENFNLFKAVVNACFKINLGAKTVINQFFYPKLGPGMLYEKMSKILKKNGIKISVEEKAVGFQYKSGKISKILFRNKSGKEKWEKTDIVVSTMPFNKLVSLLYPTKKISESLKKLKFRSFLTANLIIKSNPFPDQWIYIHDPEVKVGRIQNFRNWSPYMVKKGTDFTPIALEYFASENDSFWTMKDNEILELAKQELIKIGLVKPDEIVSGFIHRVNDAYPIYLSDYQILVKHCRKFLQKYKNLHLCGRGGLFRYNNQDHSILTGFYVARNILDGKETYDVWSVNEDSIYLESK